MVLLESKTEFEQDFTVVDIVFPKLAFKITAGTHHIIASFRPKDDRFIVVVPLCRDIFLGSVDGEGRNIEESIKELYPHAEFLVCVELESEEDESMHEMWIVPKPPANKNVVIDDIGICRNPTAIYRVIGI